MAKNDKFKKFQKDFKEKIKDYSLKEFIVIMCFGFYGSYEDIPEEEDELKNLTLFNNNKYTPEEIEERKQTLLNKVKIIYGNIEIIPGHIAHGETETDYGVVKFLEYNLIVGIDTPHDSYGECQPLIDGTLYEFKEEQIIIYSPIY